MIKFELAFLAFVVKVCLSHMACQVGGGIEGLDEVTFLYRLTPGACPKSYGVNVARLAGTCSLNIQTSAGCFKFWFIEFELWGLKLEACDI